MRKVLLLGASLAIVLSAIMVLSPVGQSIDQGLEMDMQSGVTFLGYSFGALFAGAVEVGQVPQSQILEVGVTLPLNDQNGLSNFVQEVSTPGSPEFEHYITPAEFTNLYSPSAAQYMALEKYFSSYGLSLVTSSNRLTLGVSGTASQMGPAFGTSFAEFKTTSGAEYYGPVNAPTVPSSLGITSAYGFTNALFNQPASLVQSSSPSDNSPAASCSGGDTPTEIHTAYNWSLLPSGDTGTGMTIGIVDTYDSSDQATTLSSDLSSFESACSVASSSLKFGYPVYEAGINTSASSGWGAEEDLDIQWSHVMAPGADQLMAFSPNSGEGLYLAINWLVTNDLVNVISLSWGEPDVGTNGSCTDYCNASTDGSLLQLHPVLEAAAAEGISVFVASGDCGAADGTTGVSTDYPASDEDATGVGGTTLTLGTGGAYKSEKVWSGNESGTSCDNGGGAGGGWAHLPQPWYQHGYGVKDNGLRGVPDVGITAGTALVEDNEGGFGGVAGTSDAAPQWAGITAVADQVHGGGLGLINPELYDILRSTSGYNASFHEITGGTGNGYPPNPGWEPISGIGTPKISVLVPELANGSFTPTLNPIAINLTASTTSGSAPLSVTFTAKATGGTGTYPWYDFSSGDGNATLTKSSTDTYKYENDGTYMANVEVFDSSGNSSESTLVQINVGTTSFTIGLSASNTTPAAGSSVTFTASPSGGTSPYSIYYQFGDGSYSPPTSSTTYSHTYRQAGTYDAQVNATDSKSPADGATSKIVVITVSGSSGSSPTVSSFTATPNPVTVNTSTTITTVASGGTAPYTYAYTGLPTGCSASTSASFSCSPSATGTFKVGVTVTDAKSKTATASLNLTVQAATSSGPTISSFSASPSTITLGNSTTFTTVASGGTGALSYAYTGLPAGCATANKSTLPCTPTATGNVTVTVTVTDTKGKIATKTTTLDVESSTASGPTISLFGASPNPVTVGNSTTFTTSASGGTGTLSYSYSGLPTGCSTSNLASLPCTPTATGDWNVTVTVTDAKSKTASKSTVLDVEAASSGGSPTVTSFSASPSQVTVDATTTFTTVASGGTGALSYGYSGLPTGCATANEAVLPCTPTAVGNSTVTVTVTDTKGKTGTATTTLEVEASSGGSPTVSTFEASPNPVTVNNPTTLNVEVTGGTGPYTYAYNSLPQGCSTSSTAALPCTPTATGNFTVSVTVTDSKGLTGSKTMVLDVEKSTTSSTGPAIEGFSVTPATVASGASVTFVVNVTGGALPLTYAYTGLPSGCSTQNAATFSCKPNSAGTFQVTVYVNDSEGRSVHGSTTLVVTSSSNTSSNTLFGLSTENLLLMILVIAVVVAIVVLLIIGRKKPPVTASTPPRGQPLPPWDESGQAAPSTPPGQAPPREMPPPSDSQPVGPAYGSEPPVGPSL